MAGFDKHLIAEYLKSKGWTEVSYPNEYLPPGRTLGDDFKSNKFNIYQARDLQELLDSTREGREFEDAGFDY